MNSVKLFKVCKMSTRPYNKRTCWHVVLSGARRSSRCCLAVSRWNEIQPRTRPTAGTCSPTTNSRRTRLISNDVSPAVCPCLTHLHRPVTHSRVWRVCVMFNVVHQGRKYVPTRCSVTDDSPLTVQAVHISRTSETPEATWPPPGAKMRFSKSNKGAVVVRAVRRHPSPQPASLESLEAAWSERRRPEGLPSPERRNGEAEAAGNGLEDHGGGPHRGRKRGFRPPDVRTIFSPGERDPRVKEESGEGHTFCPTEEDTWCDVCCHYIFQGGLTCAGECADYGIIPTVNEPLQRT